jgi:hypothetical protein
MKVSIFSLGFSLYMTYVKWRHMSSDFDVFGFEGRDGEKNWTELSTPVKKLIVEKYLRRKIFWDNQEFGSPSEHCIYCGKTLVVKGGCGNSGKVWQEEKTW